MYCSGLGIVIVCALLGQATAQLPTRTLSPEYHHAELKQGNHDLRLRQLDHAMTSGTITITIAPDQTCGYDQLGDPAWTCNSGHHCSWESGRFDVVFCGWQSLATTCMDASVISDTDLCDDACQSNTNIAACTSTEFPYCVEIDFGNDISTWGCANTTSSYSYDTTQSLQDRNFKTMILVDGTPMSTFISSATTSKSETITTDTTTTQVTATTTSTTSLPTGHHDTNVGAIVGGVVGGVAAIGLAVLGVLGILFLRRRKRNTVTHTTLQPNYGPDPQVQPQLNAGNTPNVMISPTETEYGITMNSPVKSQVQTLSPSLSVSPNPTYSTTYSPPPIQQEPSLGGAQMYELDGDKANHHHGSIQELH